MNIRYVFFDVANTLLHKPDLFPNIKKELLAFGYDILEKDLQKNHKLLSEVYRFPDKTSKSFYQEFNADFLLSLGISPETQLLENIFNACSYLAWKPFDDTRILSDISIPMGIISNWDKSLPEKLQQYFQIKFDTVFVSEVLNLKKPSVAFYQNAIDNVKIAPEQILYVGDSLKLDILPASSLGIKSVLLDRENNYPYFNGLKINSLDEIKNYF